MNRGRDAAEGRQDMKESRGLYYDSMRGLIPVQVTEVAGTMVSVEYRSTSARNPDVVRAWKESGPLMCSACYVGRKITRGKRIKFRPIGIAELRAIANKLDNSPCGPMSMSLPPMDRDELAAFYRDRV